MSNEPPRLDLMFMVEKGIVGKDKLTPAELDMFHKRQALMNQRRLDNVRSLKDKTFETLRARARTRGKK